MSDTFCGEDSIDHGSHSWGDLLWCPGTPAVAASTGTSEDVEALAEVLYAAACRQGPTVAAWDFARAVLASDWLAAREAAARAEALREAADAFGHMWQADAIPSASIVYRALRDRAARIAREGRP